MSAITLAVNYWRWEGRREDAIKADINTYQEAVAAQQKGVLTAAGRGLHRRPHGADVVESELLLHLQPLRPARDQPVLPYAGFPVHEGHPTEPKRYF